MVEHVITAFVDELVDLVEGDDHDPRALVDLPQQEVVHPLGGEAREGNPLVEVLDESIPHVLENAVGSVDDFAVDVEVLYMVPGIRLRDFVADVLHHGGLPRPGLPEDHDVGGPLPLEGRRQDGSELVDLLLAVG